MTHALSMPRPHMGSYQVADRGATEFDREGVIVAAMRSDYIGISIHEIPGVWDAFGSYFEIVRDTRQPIVGAREFWNGRVFLFDATPTGRGVLFSFECVHVMPEHALLSFRLLLEAVSAASEVRAGTARRAGAPPRVAAPTPAAPARAALSLVRDVVERRPSAVRQQSG